MGALDNQFRFKGTFDYHGLYNLMREFFESRKFDLYEDRYKDKGDEVEVEWRAERNYDEIHKVIIKVKWHIWDFSIVKEETKGKRKKIIKGRIQIDISGKTETDYSQIYTRNDFIEKWLLKINKAITQREEDENWSGEPVVLQHKLLSEIRSFMKKNIS